MMGGMYVSMYLFRVTITPEIPEVIEFLSYLCKMLEVYMLPVLQMSQELIVFAQEAPLWVQVLHPVSVLIGVSEKEVWSKM